MCIESYINTSSVVYTKLYETLQKSLFHNVFRQSIVIETQHFKLLTRTTPWRACGRTAPCRRPRSRRRSTLPGASWAWCGRYTGEWRSAFSNTWGGDLAELDVALPLLAIGCLEEIFEHAPRFPEHSIVLVRVGPPRELTLITIVCAQAVL